MKGQAAGAAGIVPLGRRATLAIFFAALIGLSALFDGMIVHAGHLAAGGGACLTGLMWSPALAAVAALALRREPLPALGLSAAAVRFWPIAYLLPLLYAAAAYAAVWVTGAGSVPDPTYVEARRASLGWAGAPDALVLLGGVALAATTGLMHSLGNALGEEIGWRGFLDPVLRARFGFLRGALATGCVWAAWHGPILLLADYHSAVPTAFALPCFAVLVLAVSVMLAWLRERSASVWPCAWLHAAHNLLIQGVFDPLTKPTPPFGDYAVGEFGWALAAAASVFAMIIALRRRSAR